MGSVDGDAWDRIRSLLEGSDFTRLTLAVVDLPPERRRAMVAPLRTYVAPSKYDPARGLNEAGLAIVGAGVLPDAKSVAAWLHRYGMQHHRLVDASGLRGYVETSVVPNVFYVLTERGVPWLGDLAKQIAQRLPRTADFGTERFELVCRLLEHTGTPVPTTPGFVASWVHGLGPDTVGAELAAHPEFAVLVPHLFDVEEAGVALSHDARWPDALAAVVRSGLVDRDVMLDACLARLARDGRPGATRAFLAVHDALAPTTEEVAARIAAYLAVLGSAVSTVASMAQNKLFDVEDHGLLAAADQLAVADSMLRRKEKKLVRAQLARLGKQPATDTDRKAEIARLIVSSWDGADADIVRQGMRTVAAMGLSDAAQRELLSVAPSTLPADLAAELAAIAGRPVAADASRVTSVPRRLASPPRVALAPITDLDKLAAETLALLGGDAADLTTPWLETVIDGLLIASARDRDALRRCLEPVLRSDPFRWAQEFTEYGYNRTLRHAVGALVCASIGMRPTEHPRDPHEAWSGPEALLVDRVFALATGTPLPPLSVCLPSWTNGLLDPDALFDRLERAASGGWPPPPQELELALLRLDVPGDAAERERLALAFGGLGSDAGAAAAQWIKAALPSAPVIERITVTVQHRDWQQVVAVETELVDVTICADATQQDTGAIWAGLIQPRPGTFPPPEGFRSPRC